MTEAQDARADERRRTVRLIRHEAERYDAAPTVQEALERVAQLVERGVHWMSKG